LGVGAIATGVRIGTRKPQRQPDADPHGGVAVAACHECWRRMIYHEAIEHMFD